MVAIASLILAAFEAFNQRSGSAALLGGIGVACVLLCFLPQLEVLKVFGVEAKLQKIDKAAATLDSVKRLAESTAKASYLMMAWANRFDGPSAKEKQAVLDQIDAQLAELQVDQDSRKEIQKLFVKLMKLDFYYLYTQVVMQYATLINNRLNSNVHLARDPSVAAGFVQQHSERISAWEKYNYEHNPAENFDSEPLETVIDRFTRKSGSWLSDADLGALAKFKADVVRLESECERKGGYTKEAADYYDLYGRDHAVDKARQLFLDVNR